MVAQLPMAAISTVTLNVIGCEVLQDSIQMYVLTQNEYSTSYLPNTYSCIAKG